jgi:hypothetical protein
VPWRAVSVCSQCLGRLVGNAHQATFNRRDALDGFQQRGVALEPRVDLDERFEGRKSALGIVGSQLAVDRNDRFSQFLVAVDVTSNAGDVFGCLLDFPSKCLSD